MENTAFIYRYHDGSKNNVHSQAVFAGLMPASDLGRVNGALLHSYDTDGLGDFIPGQVGLVDLQNALHDDFVALAKAMGSAGLDPDAEAADRAAAEPFDELCESLLKTKPMWGPDDHPFHTLVSVEHTDAPVTAHKTIDEFIEELEATVWDNAYKPPFYDEMLKNYGRSVAVESASE